jgi:hypothetical protein
MPALVSDDVLNLFAVHGTYQDIAQAISVRFGGMADSIDLSFPVNTPPGLQREIVMEIRRIPQQFTEFAKGW